MCLPYVRVRVACKMQSDTFDRYTTTSTKLHHKPENERENSSFRAAAAPCICIFMYDRCGKQQHKSSSDFDSEW